tara:strand:- start:628 stop:1710 length:1083 start_codon:yes stop_codon:yes gene_type:complete
MARNRNFGLGTPKLNEGLIVSGSAGYENGFSSLIVTGSAVFNEGGENMNFRVESSNKEYMLFIDAGNDKVGVGTSTPATTLHVYTDESNAYVATIDNDAGSAGHGLKVTSDGNGSGTYLFDLESGSSTLFRVRGDGRVGIGKVTSLPASLLTVSSSNTDGDIAIAHKIQHIGDSDTYVEFLDDEIQIAAGGRTFIKIEEASTDKLIINHGGLDIDFQVKGENASNLIRTDAENDTVGIRTSSPGSTLEIDGSISLSVSDTKTSSYSILATDQCIIGDCNSSSIVFTLPSATDGMVGRVYTIKRLDSGNNGGGNTLTVSRNGKNIDGVAADQILANKDALVIQCIGAAGGWILIGSYMVPL